MRNSLKYTLFGVIVVVAALQLVRPDRTNPQTDAGISLRADTSIPPSVLSVLERSCFDCHSNETRWPWYSSVTPANFMITNDVRKGRQRLNFSEWGLLKPMKRASQLEEIYDQVYNKEMPMKKYLLLHPAAALSDSEVKIVCDWTQEEQDRINASFEEPAHP